VRIPISKQIFIWAVTARGQINPFTAGHKLLDKDGLSPNQFKPGCSTLIASQISG